MVGRRSAAGMAAYVLAWAGWLGLSIAACGGSDPQLVGDANLADDADAIGPADTVPDDGGIDAPAEAERDAAADVPTDDDGRIEEESGPEDAWVEDESVDVPYDAGPDPDGDTIPSDVEGWGDPDGDTIPNALDIDSDGDGIFDAIEAQDDDLDTPPVDSDGDGIPDFLDLDSDSDTIPDEVESICDTDDDGMYDYLDLDSDDDTIPDAEEAGDYDPGTPPVNSDGDSLPDFRDLDSDDDGLPDEEEHTTYHTDPTDADTDDDGWGDYVEIRLGSDPLEPSRNPGCYAEAIVYDRATYPPVPPAPESVVVGATIPPPGSPPGEFFRVTFEFVDDPGDGHDATMLVDRIEANVAPALYDPGLTCEDRPTLCATSLAVEDTDGDGHPDAFPAVPRGAQACFRLVAVHSPSGVRSDPSPTLVYPGRLRIVLDGDRLISERPVAFIFLPTPPPSGK